MAKKIPLVSRGPTDYIQKAIAQGYPTVPDSGFSFPVFQNMKQMCDFWYGYDEDELLPTLRKTAGPVLTDTTGWKFTDYGAEVFVWANTEANAYAILPKVPLQRTGWTVETTRAAATADTLAENASAVDSSIMPDWIQISKSSKTHDTVFDASLVESFETKADVGVDKFTDYLIPRMGKQHVEMLNVALLTQNGTLAGEKVESIDRVVATTSEDQNCTDSANAAYDAGDNDIYGQDRDSSTTCDAYVNHNSGTDRQLSLSLMDTVFQNLRVNASEDPTVILTHPEGGRILASLLQPLEQYTEKTVKFTFNGVQTATGAEGGFNVASYGGVPIIHSKNSVTETSGTARFYFLNTDYLKNRIAMPPKLFLTDDVFVVGPRRKGAYLSIQELICYRFNAQGKIRDLKE